jgi:hypothetical protein
MRFIKICIPLLAFFLNIQAQQVPEGFFASVHVFASVGKPLDCRRLVFNQRRIRVLKL